MRDVSSPVDTPTSQDRQLRAQRLQFRPPRERLIEHKCEVVGARTCDVFQLATAHYEQAHGLAGMLLDGLGVDDLMAPGGTRSFAFLLDMNLLFERFIEKLVRRALPAHYRVRYQAAQRSIIWNTTEQRPYSRVVPDLLVERHAGGRMAIDSKYKLYDERRLDPGDIYQTFLYAYALGSRPGEAPPTSLILYPSSVEAPGSVRLRIRPLHRRGAAEILGLGISIPAALADWADEGRGA